MDNIENGEVYYGTIPRSDWYNKILSHTKWYMKRMIFCTKSESQLIEEHEQLESAWIKEEQSQQQSSFGSIRCPEAGRRPNSSNI